MEVEFIWNLISFGQCGLSVIERYRIIEVEFIWNLVCLGPSELSSIERCPYYRGRVCMEFGLFRTM